MSSIPPVVDLDGAPSGSVTLAYTENDLATVIAPAGITTDSDSPDFNGGSLTVSFGSSGASEDQLSILTDGTVTVSAGVVSVGGLAIGTVSGGGDGADLVVTFDTANATPAAVSALIERIAYFNNSENPSTSARSVTFTVDDGDGATGSDTATINVEAVNDPPANTTPAGPQSTPEDTPLTILSVQVGDVDIGGSNVITVTLSVTHGTIHIDPNVSGGIDYLDIVDNDTSTVTLSCDPELVNVTLAAGIVYTPASDFNGSDTLTVATSDGGNTGTGGPKTTTNEIAINVNAVNDLPDMVDVGGGFVPYTENGSAVVLDNDGTVSDRDLNGFESYAGATLALQRQGGANPDDVFGGTTTATGSLDLTHSNGLGENVSLDDGTTFIGTFSQPGDGTFSVVFNGNASAGDVEKVLRLITYTNTSDAPPNTVLIDFTFSDGNGQPGGQDQGSGASPGTATGTVTVEITPVNDAPLLVNVAAAAAYGVGTAGTLLSPGLGVFDADTPTLAAATISIATNFVVTDELFVNLTQSGGHFVTSDGDTTNITLQSNASGTLMLVGQDTFANWQSVLDAVSYRSTAADPTVGGDSPNRTITWTINDGDLDSQTPNTDPDNLVNATILHFDTNQAPVVTGSVTLESIPQNSGARLITQAELLSNATDPNGDLLTAINLAISSGIGTLVDNHNGTWSYAPAFADTTSVSFSYEVIDGTAAPVPDSAIMDIIGPFPLPDPPPTPLPAFTGTAGDDSFTAMPGGSRIDALGGTDTITFNFKLVDALVWFFGNQVIVEAPDHSSRTVISGFETFVFTDGTVNNNDGNPLVDDLYYYVKNHDVWNAHADADAHYNALGWHEGRNPNEFFQTVVYLSANPDVKASGVNPLTHYDTVGWTQGIDPSIRFDTDAYLKAYPDVAAAHVDPLAEFLQHGQENGRTNFVPSTMVAENGFDFVYYLLNNPSVVIANADPLQHFETVGWKAGLNPNAYFDVNGYLANYPGVKAAGVNPLDHYHTTGWHDGNDPSVNFDTTSYLAAYADVAAANVDPLKHFLTTGLAEGRQAFPDGIWG